MNLKIGIVGKRHVANESKVAENIKTAIAEILKEYKTTEFIGYTGLAVGADSIFAGIVTGEFGQPLQVILPFEKNMFVKGMTSIELQKFENYIKLAREIEILDLKTINNQNSDEAYFEAGKKIINNCDRIIFVWDELKPSGRGGTAEIMAYYMEEKNLKEYQYVITEPEMQDLIHNELLKKYNISDKAAIRNRDKYRKIWTSVLFLGWFAVFFFALNIGYNLNGLIKVIVVFIEFLLVLIVFAFIMVAKSKNYHGKYMKERLFAERLRLLKTFYHADVTIEIPEFIIEINSPFHEWVKKINNSIAQSKYQSKWYRNFVIKSLIISQKNYCQARIKEIGKKHLLWENINGAVVIVFFLNLSVHLFITFRKFYYNLDANLYIENLIIFASILLPATYAAIEGLLYFWDWELHRKFVEFAEKKFSSEMENLPAEKNHIDENAWFAQQEKVLNHISGIMLADNISWQMVLEGKSDFHWIV